MYCFKKFTAGLGCVFALTLSAQAADFYVATTGSDDNPGTSELPFLTISNAIAAANAAIIGETLSSVTISVGAGIYTNSGMRLDYPITVTGDITDPSKVEIVDAVQDSRAFTITNAAARLEGVTISGLGMRGARGSSGGHVYMKAGTVADCVITGGRASRDGGGNGGNVAISGGQLLRSIITKGMASTHNGDQGNVGTFRGGNVFASGTALVANCVIAEGNSNWLRKGNPLGGVGIALQGSAKAVNCTIVKNRAKAWDANVGAYGVYCESSSARVINCVIYDNGNTSKYEFYDTNPSCFINCAFAAGAAGSTVSPVTGVTTFDFADYANGDYHYPINSIMINVGDNELYPTEAGSTDLDGEARVSDTIIDIGCYERDLTSAIVYGSVEAYSVVGGESMTFTANAKGGAGTYKYKWNFGDGSAEQETSETSVTHSFGYGLYQVSIAVSEDDGANWSAPVPLLETIRVYPATIYVDPQGVNGSTPTYPYSTAATAAHKLWDAIYTLTNSTSAGKPVKSVSTTIQILDGTLAATDKGFTISAPITIRGNAADRSKVTIGPSSSTDGRIFTLSVAGATLADLTIRNGKNAYGGNVNMAAGTMVTNCVVTGGKSVSSNNADFGGNIYMSGGTVSGCEVKNGNCSANNNYSAGLGIHATGGLIENCYIHGNYGKTNGGKTGGVDLRGAAYIVNCTVVDNYREGDSGSIAQVHVNDTNARVVNCAFFKAVDKVGTTFDGDNGGCYYGCAAQTTITSGKDCIVIDKSAFCGAVGGDYHVPATSPLFDGGDRNASVKYETYAKSTVDYEGNPRISPLYGTIDIGCYEYDQTYPTADGSPDKYSAAINTESVRFTAIAVGTLSSSVLFKWNFDDGAGSEVTTSSTVYDYTFVNPGLHSVSVSMSDNSGYTWSTPRVISEQIVTYPAVMYVDPTKASTPTFPYATKATAAWTIKDTLNCLTNNYSLGTQVSTVVAEIRVMDGDISGTNLKLDAAVTITSDSRDATKASIAGTSSARVFYLNHSSAKVTHLTVKNGTCATQYYVGNNIYLNKGLVEDCIVKDGGGSTANGAGGNIYLVSGRVNRSVISGGKCTYGGSGTGSNVYIGGAGTVENCLIVGGQLNKNGNGQVYLNHASARVVNCTILKGTGISTSVAFGVYVNNASAKVANCVIYDNGGTATREWGNANAACFIDCAFTNGVYTGSASTVTNLTHEDFVNYAEKDYTPTKESQLVKAGTSWADYLTYGGTSTTDLAGEQRRAGKVLDIGCYCLPTAPGFTVILR